MSNANGMKPLSVELTSNYTQQFDYDGSNNMIYVGAAPIGTATSAAKWQIKKLSYSGANLTAIQFADGNDAFDNVWDNRTGYSYS